MMQPQIPSPPPPIPLRFSFFFFSLKDQLGFGGFFCTILDFLRQSFAGGRRWTAQSEGGTGRMAGEMLTLWGDLVPACRLTVV